MTDKVFVFQIVAFVIRGTDPSVRSALQVF